MTYLGNSDSDWSAMTSYLNISTARRRKFTVAITVRNGWYHGNNKKKRSANLQQTEKELLVDLVTKYHAVIECKARRCLGKVQE